MEKWEKFFEREGKVILAGACLEEENNEEKTFEN